MSMDNVFKRISSAEKIKYGVQLSGADVRMLMDILGQEIEEAGAVLEGWRERLRMDDKLRERESGKPGRYL